MKFPPLTEEQIQTTALVPEGYYKYQVIKALEGVSQAGNDKIDLTLKVWNDEGREGLIFTNLSLIKLLKHFCDVNGLQDNYNAGEISDILCKGKSGGCVMIGIEGEKPNNKGGVYPAKNIVKDYIVAPQGSTLSPGAMKPLPEMKNEFDDTIPF